MVKQAVFRVFVLFLIAYRTMSAVTSSEESKLDRVFYIDISGLVFECFQIKSWLGTGGKLEIIILNRVSMKLPTIQFPEKQNLAD